ncbi:c-type cytochrome [Pelagicoccus sp. SDUM812005]|uniref:c-type cytochrome n=1 Tax=Pelagicoccus sp. SDUM812005 TaxID=3041257 RepID=UPI00280ECC34|nr:c-type cytochrome [Pelagicoccus sp. SDUM812005]MDQ8182039.1 c-type cytochrome [Pelagicoccus sp. SDUM812005]
MTTRSRLISAFASLVLFPQLHSQTDTQTPSTIDPKELNVAEGFTVDLVYTVPKETQGSWVGLTCDDQGRILASDQYGSIYRLTPSSGDDPQNVQIEKLVAKLPALSPSIPESEAGAHGLLYAAGSLYVMVSETEGKRGIWRLRDLDGDDQFEKADYLIQLDGRGEHGPHSMALSPDGKSLYFVCGNFTDLPETFDATRGVAWGEDHLLPRMWDARGHAKGRYAPGGWIGRCDLNGKNQELFAYGFRNTFDIAFDQNGELFTFDSDMEWDQGTPWYMPTRINHVVDGGDYGWRSGAGRWPDYYADSLPATIDIGPGSPTGTTFGTGTKFPAKYQRALFAADWTYGTLYAIHHTADGSTFRGEKEEFVSGKPLPLTGVIANPHDGAIYFAVGGRRTQSGLYRVTYTGPESTAPAQAVPPTEAALLRRKLEALHTASAGHEAVAIAWPHLSNPDRFIRWAARVALEHQPVSNWARLALEERNPQAKIEAMIALARVGPHRYQQDIIEQLSKLNLQAIDKSLRLPLLRAWQLAFTRMGEPNTAAKSNIVSHLEPAFPSGDPNLDRELLSLLVYLDSSIVVEKAVPLLSIEEPEAPAAELLGGSSLIARNDRYRRSLERLSEASPDRQQIAIAYRLRNADTGWTPELRKAYFEWFATTHEWKGGASFTGFLSNIRQDALETIAPEGERVLLEDISKPAPHVYIAGSIPPQGPGQLYTVESAMQQIPSKLQNRDFERGKSMFASAACVMCHRFADQGGGIGPDISGAGNRYTLRDLVENIIEPSKVISDQYSMEAITLQNGDLIIGRIVGENDDRYKVMINPMTPNQTRDIRKEQIKSREIHPVSSMPPGLVNSLNPEELQDLLAYLLSGGNPNDPMFQDN